MCNIVGNSLLAAWDEADEECEWEMLGTVFVRFVLDRQRAADVEVKPPYSWLMRLKREAKESLPRLS